MCHLPRKDPLLGPAWAGQEAPQLLEGTWPGSDLTPIPSGLSCEQVTAPPATLTQKPPAPESCCRASHKPLRARVSTGAHVTLY